MRGSWSVDRGRGAPDNDRKGGGYGRIESRVERRGPLNLLRNVLRGLTPSEPPRPQYYRVPCPLGHVLEGQRTEGYQALRCPTCGGGVFVLPRSPLPEPPGTSTKSWARTIEAAPVYDEGPMTLDEAPQDVRVIDADIEWEEPAAEAPPVRAPASAAPRTAQPAQATYAMAPLPVPSVPASHEARPATRPKARPIPKPPLEPEPEPEVEEEEFEEEFEEEQLEGRERWGARRHLVLFAGVVALVAVAAGVQMWRQRLKEMPKVVEIGRSEGLDALERGDFDAAKDLLTKAARAVDALGGEVEGAEEIRKGAREAAIYADLAPEGLEKIMEDVATAPPDERESLFARRYRGRSILVDASPMGDPRREGGVVMDCLIHTAGRDGRIDLAGFKLYESAQPKMGERFAFGGRLFSVKRRGKEWRFYLEPESGVHLEHEGALRAVGMHPSDLPPAGNLP